MKKKIFIWIGLFTLIACRPVAADPAKEWIKIVSVTPGDGAVLVTGATARITVSYQLTTADKAQIWVDGLMDPVINSYNQPHPQATVSKGTGTVDIFMSLPKIASIDYIMAYMRITENRVPRARRDIFLRWTEPAYVNVPLNPLFRSATEISINHHFPYASDLRDDLLRQGYAIAELVDRDPATCWEVRFGNTVTAAAAQDILNRCLACTPNISRVQLTPERARYIAGWATITTYGEAGDTMPRSLLEKLLKPGLTTAQFQDLIMDWNIGKLATAEAAEQQDLQARLAKANLSKVPESIPTQGLVAFYPFDHDESNALGMKANMAIENVLITNGLMYLNGLYSNGRTTDGYNVFASIGLLDYEQFTMALNFWPLDFLNQDKPRWINRSNIITGGHSSRWFGLNRSEAGNLTLTMNNSEFSHEFTDVPIASNQWHSVACALDLRHHIVRVCFDGRQLPNITLPENFTLYVIASEAHRSDKALTLTNYGNATVLHGYVDDLAVYSRALDDAELLRLHQATRRLANEAVPRPPPDVPQDNPETDN